MKNKKTKIIFIIIFSIIITISILGVGLNLLNSSDIKYIKLSDRENQLASMVGENTFVSEIKYPKDVKGEVISYEVWKNGKITDKKAVIFGGTDIINKKESMVTIYDISDDFKKCTLNLSTSSARTSFDVDLGKKMDSFTSFYTEFPNESKISPDNSYILSAMTYSNGNSIKAFYADSLDYSEFKNRVSKDDTHIVVRLDTFKTEKEAEKFAMNFNSNK